MTFRPKSALRTIGKIALETVLLLALEPNAKLKQKLRLDYLIIE